MERAFRIGELSQQTGVPIHTIRFYEAEGLFLPSGRRPNGYRVYTESDVEKLKFIRKAQEFGLTLKEIQNIIRLSDQGLEPCCNFVHQLFSKKIREFEEKIASATAIRDRLQARLRHWIAPKAAKQERYAVCPQIESPKIGQTKRRVKR
jgi:DNA-binding transcriptional MerR regulator